MPRWQREKTKLRQRPRLGFFCATLIAERDAVLDAGRNAVLIAERNAIRLRRRRGAELNNRACGRRTV